MLIFGVGDFRTVDPWVSEHLQSWIKAEILMKRGGADRTVDPGVPKDVTFLTSSVALLL